MVLLALVVIGVLHTATMDLKVAKNQGDRIQARYLALAGIEKATALLYVQARSRTQNGVGHDRELFDAPDKFREVRLGRGEFSVFHRASQEDGGGVVYGVSDEDGKLNVNSASVDELTKLDGLTLDVASAILAWRGEAVTTNASGANAEYYASLAPPYLPRNGPFQTLRELLMVKGISSDNLFGSDDEQNGFLPESSESANADAGLGADEDGGWAANLTVDSSVANVNAAGTARVNIQSDGEAALTGVNGITTSIARAIVQYRGQHPYKSIADLLDVTPSANRGGSSGSSDPANSGQDDSSTGGRVVSEDLLTDIADDLTIDSDQEKTGLINPNTANLETLMCLPGMDRERAQAIVSFVRAQGSLPNVAWLLKVPGMDRDLFKQIAPLLTMRSETFRIVSEGRIKSTGANQRIQVIVRVNRTGATTLSYREDNL
jgi:DNA uptake protein ComE-like DNA-binding protein